jgi:type II secretory pathway predicted ATPase ExeA
MQMTKNHHDQQDALFESSDYLADVLAQCAFIERKFYRDGRSVDQEGLENVLVRLYRAILHYTVLVQKVRSANKGKKLLDCVSAITEHPLTELKALVEKERESLHRCIELGEYLHREEEAENILHKIDELAESMKLLVEQFSLVNLRVAEGALYDSYVNQHEDFCLPDTRTDLQHQILEWAVSDSKSIFWLNGMAGTGKSTIARTVAQSFKNQGLLGATFFFKRGEVDRGNAKYMVSTITRQLVTRYRRLVPDVLNAIKNDPNIASKFLSEQFDKLLYQPLLKLHPNQSATIVIVIDALDECDKEDDIRVILQLLFKLQKIKSVHLRVLLTSRPELPIRLGFRENENHQDLALHELPVPVIEHDIRVFLEHKLSEIQHERSLPQDWPGNDNVEKLVRMAVPLFIFAATLCRFVGDRDWLPQERLAAILQDKAATSTSDIDRTYLPVLNQLLASKSKNDSMALLQEFQDIIGVIVLLATPLSVFALARLTGISNNAISNRLNRFHAVLNVPEDPETPVRILHLSFRDFLINTEGQFHVDEKGTHGKIALYCLQTMDTQLKHNICDLASYGTQREDIDPQIINQYIKTDLQYSCCFWVYHLKESTGRMSQSKVLTFLKNRFLHWLEALALIGSISDAVEMIHTLRSSVWVRLHRLYS